jgi:MinD superfamily P-loop ATPase
VKEVVVLSGKGGTGKTSIVGCFASLASGKVLADCDVDAADLHLLLKPSVREKREFWSGQSALIDDKLCTRCGMCDTVCRFDAVTDFVVDPLACEGCGFCVHVCPEHCISMTERMAGHWFISDTRHGPLVHAQLGIAEENSGKLVTVVRNQARIIAKKENLARIIIDGPPGIGCPVISSLSGVNLALLVTEPTLSGMHDLERVIDLCRHFGVPALVCINKYNINEDNSRRIMEQCRAQGIQVAAQIPFDTSVTEALIKGLSVVEYSRDGVASQIEALWNSVLKRLEEA